MGLYEYKWIEDVNLSQNAPFCRGRDCARAHYKDGQPKRKMVALTIQPSRANYYSFMWFCDHCKRIVVPGDMQDHRSYAMVRDSQTGEVTYQERGTF